MLIADSILQNRYKIVRQLGQGGKGAVYEALDMRLECTVALKEALAAKNPSEQRAFEREASLLANLRHHALPKVMDHFSEDEGQFLVMEYIPGYDLAALLELRTGAFPQTQVLHWADELLDVLEYLHGQTPPIVHRDIKPSNLKLTKRGELFLLDFGLAKGSIGQMSSFATNQSQPGFTLQYAPLEQIHNGGTDERSDLYSLGATLYHLLAGYPAADSSERFNAIEEERPDPLQPIDTINSEVSPSIAAVIQAAMSVSRKQRLGKATEMRKAFQQAIEEDSRSAAREEYRRAEEAEKQRERALDKVVLNENLERRKAELLAADTRPLLDAKPKTPTRTLGDAKVLDPALDKLVAEKEDLPRTGDAQKPEKEPRQSVEVAENADLKQSGSEPQSEIHRVARREEIIETLSEAGFVKGTILPPGSVHKGANNGPNSSTELQPVTTSSNLPNGSFDVAKPKLPSNRWLILVVLLLVLCAAIPAGLALKDRWQPNLPAATERVTGSTNEVSKTNNDSPANANGSFSPEPATSQIVPPTGMAYVPGGEFVMGSNDADATDNERPAHKVAVEPFFIDIYEVTNDDYLKFIKATGHAPPKGWKRWVASGVPPEMARKPVVGVKLMDATKYANWANKRLPTEAEWEFAARGTDGRRYPWGNDWKIKHANANGASTGMAEVGTFDGKSPYGLYDMAGNAWEWTSSEMRPYNVQKLTRLPSPWRVIRSGTWASEAKYVTTTYRTGYHESAANDYSNMGFRCAKSSP
jgi:formylglycine-generating enzyme required for sulfatase activity